MPPVTLPPPHFVDSLHDSPAQQGLINVPFSPFMQPVVPAGAQDEGNVSPVTLSNSDFETQVLVLPAQTQLPPAPNLNAAIPGVVL